jgi:hypothetical protein
MKYTEILFRVYKNHYINQLMFIDLRNVLILKQRMSQNIKMFYNDNKHTNSQRIIIIKNSFYTKLLIIKWQRGKILFIFP